MEASIHRLLQAVGTDAFRIMSFWKICSDTVDGSIAAGFVSVSQQLMRTFLFHQSATVRKSFVGFVGQLLSKEIPERELRCLFDIVYGELQTVVKTTEDLNEQFEYHRIDKPKY
jgi:hypothetical protein